MDTADYLVLAEDLARFELQDIEAGLNDLGDQERREGETAFPELGKLKRAIVERKLLREAEEVRKVERDLYEYRKHHPEEFCSLQDIVQDWMDTHSKKEPLKSLPAGDAA